jgi:hypothetical protein
MCICINKKQEGVYDRIFYSSSGLKTPFFALRILHSGQRHVSGTASHPVPGDIPFLGSPFKGS